MTLGDGPRKEYWKAVSCVLQELHESQDVCSACGAVQPKSEEEFVDQLLRLQEAMKSELELTAWLDKAERLGLSDSEFEALCGVESPGRPSETDDDKRRVYGSGVNARPSMSRRNHNAKMGREDLGFRYANTRRAT